MRLLISIVVVLAVSVILSMCAAGCRSEGVPWPTQKTDFSFRFGDEPDLGTAEDGSAEADLNEPAADILLDDIAAPPRDFASGLCETPRFSCRAHLAAGCKQNKIYPLIGQSVWCNQTDDGGGWILGYVNSNNWKNAQAAVIPSVMVGNNIVYSWYASAWYLTNELSPMRLGRAWNGRGALKPDTVGGIDMDTFYKNGFVQVRLDFVRGSDGRSTSGWCETSGWNFAPTAAGLPMTCRPPAPGSGVFMCMATSSTRIDQCDRLGYDTAWAGSISMQSLRLNQAFGFSTGPNHLILGVYDDMVMRYEDPNQMDNTIGEDYLTRVWLREP